MKALRCLFRSGTFLRLYNFYAILRRRHGIFYARDPLKVETQLLLLMRLPYPSMTTPAERLFRIYSSHVSSNPTYLRLPSNQSSPSLVSTSVETYSSSGGSGIALIVYAIMPQTQLIASIRSSTSYISHHLLLHILHSSRGPS